MIRYIPMLINGQYQVARADTLAALRQPDGRPWTGRSAQAARRKAERVNGARLPPRCSADEFDRLTAGAFVSPRMIAALRLVMVDKQTWRMAAESAGVTESGMLRAMRRIAARNPFP